MTSQLLVAPLHNASISGNLARAGNRDCDRLEIGEGGCEVGGDVMEI
jgi:hypothetical protein